MTSPIIPTVFAKNRTDFQNRFQRLVGVSRKLQIDFMDGKFVKAKSATLTDVPDLKRLSNVFEAHLMVQNPISWIPKLKRKGFKIIIFHLESQKSPEEAERTIKAIRDAHLTPALALNPETPIEDVTYLLDLVPIVLFMGHKPGVEQIPFLPEVIQKIRRLRELNKRISIQVDGGVSVQNAARLASIGVDRFNIGSFISMSGRPAEAIRLLEEQVHEGIKKRRNVQKISHPYDAITNLIYIGPNRCCILPGFDKELLRMGIRADISLEEFRVDTPKGVQHYLWLPVADHKPPSLQQFFTGVAFIDELVKQRVKLFVHCELGHTRAPTLVVAYFISQGMALDAAIAYVRKRRPSMGITGAQRKGLEKFERAWKRRK